MTAGGAGAPPPGAAPRPGPSLPAPVVAVVELTLGRGSIPHLLRHPALGLGPPLPSEGEQVACQWHDTPDYALAAQGRALCRATEGWALEEILPGAGVVAPPGSAARVVRSATRLDDLAVCAGEALRPVASFAGMAHRGASGPHEAELLDGHIEAQGAEHPVCRLRLRGYAPAEAALLAEALPLEVPNGSLPAFALHLATGSTLPEPGRTRIAEGSLGRFSGAHIAGAAASVVFWCRRAEAEGETEPEAVHRARVAIRRLRSVLRLLHPVISCPDLDAAEEELRTAFAKLGGCRDLDVFLAGVGAQLVAAIPDEPRLEGLLQAVGRRRARAWGEARRWLASPAWRIATVRLAAFAVVQPWTGAEDDDRRQLLEGDALLFGQRALRRARRKVLAAGPVEALPDDALHKLRRRCKRLRYAAELFAPFFPKKPTRRFLRRLARVQDAMGAVTDSAAVARLASGPGRGRTFAGGAVVGWTAATGRAARGELALDWQRFCDAEPFWR